jgi:hypothetical protein
MSETKETGPGEREPRLLKEVGDLTQIDPRLLKEVGDLIEFIILKKYAR